MSCFFFRRIPRCAGSPSDPNARTYDFLKRLDHPHLALEDDGTKKPGVARSFNPYDRDASPGKRKKRPSD